jgi:hypothetical protein
LGLDWQSKQDDRSIESAIIQKSKELSLSQSTINSLLKDSIKNNIVTLTKLGFGEDEKLGLPFDSEMNISNLHKAFNENSLNNSQLAEAVRNTSYLVKDKIFEKEEVLSAKIKEEITLYVSLYEELSENIKKGGDKLQKFQEYVRSDNFKSDKIKVLFERYQEVVSAFTSFGLHEAILINKTNHELAAKEDFSEEFRHIIDRFKELRKLKKSVSEKEQEISTLKNSNELLRKTLDKAEKNFRAVNEKIMDKVESKVEFRKEETFIESKSKATYLNGKLVDQSEDNYRHSVVSNSGGDNKVDAVTRRKSPQPPSEKNFKTQSNLNSRRNNQVADSSNNNNFTRTLSQVVADKERNNLTPNPKRSPSPSDASKISEHSNELH